jgi:hypothetical protein
MTIEQIDPNDGDISKANVTDEVLRIVAQADDHSAPRVLLEAARSPDSPLHRYFTWDDSLAGERYRLAQAGALYRTVKMQIVRMDAEAREIKFEQIRAVISVPSDRKKKDSKSYGRTTAVASDEQRRASVLRGIVREIVALRNKYAKFSELHDVWIAIDDAADQFDPPSTKRNRAGKSAPPPAA